jgi:site-specific recombinase XerD
MMNRFTNFSELRGYLLLDQWGPIDVREFRAAWEVAPNTATKNMTILKSFFEFAVSNEWLDRNPARLVKDRRTRSEKQSKDRIPFSDEELARMFETCESKYGKTDDELWLSCSATPKKLCGSITRLDPAPISSRDR